MFSRTNVFLPKFLPLFYLLGAWAVNYLLGFMSLDYSRHSTLARDAGASVVLPLLTAMLWWGRIISISVGVKALSYVASHRRTRNAAKLAKTFDDIINYNLKKFRLVVLTSASLIAFNYLYWGGLFAPPEVQLQLNPYRYLLLLQTLPLWFCIINYFVGLIVVFNFSKMYFTRYLRVRLFEIEELSPLCNLVVVNFLITSLAISTYSINGLFFDLPDTDKYAMIVGCMLLAFFLFSPIFIVRKVLKGRKEMTLERINHSLNTQLLVTPDSPPHRRLVDDNVRLQFISDLLIVRKEVNRAPLWPMSVPFAIKMMLVLMLPVFSWLGAGFVSQFLKLWQA